MPTIVKKIFRALKKEGRPQRLTVLAEAVGMTDAQLLTVLLDMVEKHWIRLDPAPGKGLYDIWVSIPYPLEPPLKPEPPFKVWDYEKIQAAEGAPGAGPTQRRLINPLKRYLPAFDQNGRGTCVGHACAYLMQQNYLQITKDYPTQEEMAQAKYNELKTLNYPCLVRFDRWFRTVFSPQWCYHISRLVGNITYPTGSYCSAAIEAMKLHGGVTWDEVLTPKTSECAPYYPREKPRSESNEEETLEVLKILARDHKLDGYVKAITFEAVCALIEKYGGVIMPINIYSNYTNNGGKGMLPDPDDLEDLAGSHAMFWDGYDLVRGELYGRHSWCGPHNIWSTETGITKFYYSFAAGPAFAPLDSDEVRIAQTIYALIFITSNLPVARYIIKMAGGPEWTYTEDPLKVTLERGRSYTITAYARDPLSVKEPSLTRSIIIGQESPAGISIQFTFTPVEPIPPPGPGISGLLKKIMEFIRRLLNRR